MSLLLRCRICGSRPVSEFVFGGELPDVPATVTSPDARDVDRIWMRTNACGVTVERWFHDDGCRRWTTIRRDTLRDEVV
jgi:sarcosine oxidase, subunit delta